MAFCIRPELADKLKAAAKAGEITIEKLYTMSSKERRELFGKYVDTETAKGVNTGFEKAMVSEQQKAIESWVKRTFSSGEKKKAGYQDIITKINDLEKQGVLNPTGERAFLEDLVREKLGATVTPEEAAGIAKHSQAIEQHAKDVSPVNTHTIEYYLAKRKAEDYLQSLVPASNLRVFTSTIGRGAMLLSVKSPLLNIVSNSIQGFLEAAERRIERRRFNGFNAGFAREFKNYARDVYNKTGYDLSRYQAFEGGLKTLGEDFTHSQGKGVVRAIGRLYEDIAFSKLQGRPDAAFSRFHFTDSANLSSSALALAEGLKGKEAKARSLEILKDAVSENPQTKEGVWVKAQAEADALYATYTNKSLASETALKLRSVINTASGDFRLGDITDPFVKTPANVLQAGLDYSGVSLTAKTATGIAKTLNDLAHGKSFDKDNFAGIQKYFIRAGLGTLFAYVVSSIIKPEDFLGAYPTDQKEQQLFNERQGVKNSIKIGDRWVSLDYLGPLGAPLLGFLYAKKYGGKDVGENISQFGLGSTSTLTNFPGWNTVAQAYDYLDKAARGHAPVSQVSEDAFKQAAGAITSRIIPGIVNDFASMLDTYNRETDKNDFTTKVQKQIPWLREGLPIAHDIFGTPEKTEPWVSTLLFGARVKTANDSALMSELVRLNSDGALPAITDVARTSSRAKNLKEQLGEQKFNEAMHYFGTNLKQNFIDAIDSSDYSDGSPDDKKNILNKVKEDTFNDMLDEYNYEPPEK